MLLVCLLVLISCKQEQGIQRLIQDLGRKMPVFGGSTPRSRAIRKLRKIGELAVPALIQALEDKNPEICVGATMALSGMEDEAGPFLIQALQNPSVKSLAVDTFVLIGKKSLPDLIQTLKDNRSEFRASAAEVLGRIGSEDPETMTALIRTLQDSVPIVRANAADALVRIGTPEAIESVLPVLKQSLWSEDPVVRANVANALIEIGTPEAVEPVLTIFKQALRRENPSVRANVTKLLEKIGTPEALKILQTNTADQP